MSQEVSTPAVMIDLDIAYRNIRKMAEENDKYQIAHRPHIKAHKCPFLAQKQLELGAKGITCAKLSEAEVMADHGITDILIAFPLIGQDKWRRYASLSQRAQLLTIVNSVHGSQGLSDAGQKMGKKLRVLIEMDGGIGRGGVQPGKPTLEFAQKIGSFPGIHICGLLYYGGGVYGESTREGIIRAAERERDELTKTAALLRQAGFDMSILSGGSSFSAKYPAHLAGITEVRAGNYIFNDCAQLPIKLVTEEDCALRVLATVVAKPDACHAIIDAGSKSLTTDTAVFREGYGWIVGHPEIFIWKLNEEHGFLKSDTPIHLDIGEKIQIIPNHACVITNINGLVYGTSGGKVERELEISARNKNY